MNSNLLIGAVAIGLVGLVLVFSFSDSEELAEEAIVTAVEADDGLVALPADVPSNIPLYPGAKLSKVDENNEETARNITLTLETPDSVEDVNTWYRGALSQNPWAVTSDRNVGGYILLKGEHDNVAVFTQVAPRSDLGVSVITQRVQIKSL